MIGGGIDGLLADSVGSLLCLFKTRKEFSHVPFSEVVDVVCLVADRSINRVRSRSDTDSTNHDQSTPTYQYTRSNANHHTGAFADRHTKANIL